MATEVKPDPAAGIFPTFADKEGKQISQDALSKIFREFLTPSMPMPTRLAITGLKERVVDVKAIEFLFSEFCKEALELNKCKEALAFVNLLAEAGFTSVHERDLPSELARAKVEARKAKIFQEILSNKAPISLRTRLALLGEKLNYLVESLLSAFGIAEFLTPAHNEHLAQHRAMKLMSLISLFDLLLNLLKPVVGEERVGKTITGTMAFIALLSVIYPKIRPMVTEFPKGENISKKLERRELTIPTTDRAINMLIAEGLNGHKPYPLLVGPSNVGKTTRVRSFAEEVKRGEYPHLARDLVMIEFDSSALSKEPVSDEGKTILEQNSLNMGDHRHRYLVYYDEVHNLFKEGADGQPFVESLKKELDKGYPNVIASTTYTEYVDHILANPPAASRFTPIYVGNASPAQTVKILEAEQLKRAPEVPLEKDALKKLVAMTFEKFPDAPQPYQSLQILEKCLNQTRSSQRGGEEALATLEKELEEMEYFSRADKQPPTSQEILDKAEAVEKQKRALVESAGAIRHLLVEKRHLYLQFLKRIHEVALQIALGTKQGAQELLNTFVILDKFVKPQLFEQLKKQGQEMQVQAVIDEALIKKVVAAEVKALEDQKKRLAAHREAKK